MAQSKASNRQPLPIWGVVAAIVACVAVVGFFGWRSLNSNPLDAGPSMKVAPGTYDLRAEAKKAQSGNASGN